MSKEIVSKIVIGATSSIKDIKEKIYSKLDIKYEVKEKDKGKT